MEAKTSAKTSSAPKSLPPVLRMFAMASAALYGVTLLSEVLCAYVLHLDLPPYNTMTFDRQYIFADIRMFQPRFQHFHTPAFFDLSLGAHFLYPAPMALLYRFFNLWAQPALPFVSFVLLTALLLSVWLWRELRLRGVAGAPALAFVTASLLLSYPLYFETNRANMEIFVWGFSALGIFLFLRDRPWLAAVCIGTAGACKEFPLIYLGLLLLRKQYRQVALGVFTFAAVNLVSLWAITGNVGNAARGIKSGLGEFRATYVLQRLDSEIGLDHSTFGLIKRVMVHVPQRQVMAHYLLLYLIVAATAGTAIFFWRVRKLPVTNQVLFLSIACIVLPPTSYDYTLLHLYTPWVLLVMIAVEAWVSQRRTPRELWPVFVCFAILLTPQNEVIFHGERLGGQIKCVVLLALAVLACRKPLGAGTVHEAV